TAAAAPGQPAAGEELWNYGENIYAGGFIEQLDVAALGPQAPIVPGLPRLPGSGQFYASPALAALLRSTPRDQLGDRFPGTQVGLIGDTALSGPSELAVVVGYPTDPLAAPPGTTRVETVTPTVWGYAGMLVAVPLAAAAGSLASLRRVQTTPLGVARRTTPPPPTVWRVLPLLVGIPVFLYPLVRQPGNPAPAPVFLGL